MKKNSFLRIFLGVLFLIGIGTKNGYSQVSESFMNFYSEVKLSCEIPTSVDTNNLTEADKEQMAEMTEDSNYCGENLNEDGWHPYNRMLFDLDSAAAMQELQTESDSIYEYNGFIIAVHVSLIGGYDEYAYNMDSLIYEQRVYGENNDIQTILRINYVRTIDGYIVPEKIMQVWYDTLPSGIPCTGKFVYTYLYYELLDKDGNSLTKTGDENLFNECMKQLGIREIQPQANVKIYPNPTTGQLTIAPLSPPERGKQPTIEIYDIVGQKVNYQISTVNYQLSIDISHLANGLYFLKIDGKTVKIVKE